LVGRLFFGRNPDWGWFVLRPFADNQRRPFADNQRRMAVLSCAAAASEVTSLPQLRQAQRACTSASSLAATALAAAPSGSFLPTRHPSNILSPGSQNGPAYLHGSRPCSGLRCSRPEYPRWWVLVVLILASTRLGIVIPRCCGVNDRLFDTALIVLASPVGRGTVAPRWCDWLSWVVFLGQEPSWRRSQVAAVVPTMEGRLDGLVGGHSPLVTRLCGWLS